MCSDFSMIKELFSPTYLGVWGMVCVAIFSIIYFFNVKNIVTGRFRNLEILFQLLIIFAFLTYTVELFGGCLCKSVFCHSKSWVINFCRFAVLVMLLLGSSIATSLKRPGKGICTSKLSLISMSALWIDSSILVIVYASIFTERLMHSGGVY